MTRARLMRLRAVISQLGEICGEVARIAREQGSESIARRARRMEELIGEAAQMLDLEIAETEPRGRRLEGRGFLDGYLENG